MPFGFHLTMDILPSGVPQEGGFRSALAVSGFRLRARLGFSIPAFFPRPARHYPHFRIWHPSSGHQRDFNPPELRAAQRTIRPLLTSRSGSTPSPFRAQGEISPGKNALLHCTTAGSTPPCLDHESFAVICPLALLGNAFYPVLVHRLAASLHASSPHSVTLMQLRFTSFAVINLRWDFHPQECAHAGRTKRKGATYHVTPLFTGAERGIANHPTTISLYGSVF